MGVRRTEPWALLGALAQLALAFAGCAEGGLEPCKHSCREFGYPPGPYGGGLHGTLADLPLRLWQDRNHDGVSDDGPMSGHLSDYRGRALAGGPRVLVIAGYAEWCGPCVVAQLEVSPLARANPDIAFLTVLLEGSAGNVPSDADATRWARAFQVPHDLARSEDANLAAQLGMDRTTDPLPDQSVVNLCEMSVRARWYGVDTMRLEREIEVARDATRRQ